MDLPSTVYSSSFGGSKNQTLQLMKNVNHRDRDAAGGTLEGLVMFVGPRSSVTLDFGLQLHPEFDCLRPLLL